MVKNVVIEKLPKSLRRICVGSMTDWLGVTIRTQEEADARIPVLLQTPASKRFVSVEPLLGPVELGRYLYGSYECALSCGTRLPAATLPELRCTACGFTGPNDHKTWGDKDYAECPKCRQSGCCGGIDEVCPNCGTYMVHDHPNTPCIDWVICGGETGPGARPMHPDWVLSLRDQCQSAGVPFYFKGWGKWLPCNPNGKVCGHRLLDRREWDEIPE